MNFLEAYSDYACAVTDCPIEFHAYMALVTAGVVLGRQRYIQFGHGRIYPNFYTVILAPSSFYRKSTALGISQYCVRAIESDKVLASDFSQEKMMETLRDNSVGAFFYYEFKTLMTNMEKSYMVGVKSFLTEAFDYNDITVTRKKQTYTIVEPCLSILSATTSSWFTENVKSGDIEGGFLGRFIYIHSKNKVRDDSFPPEPDQSKRAEMVHQLGRLSGLSQYPITLSPDALKLYDIWYKNFVARVSALESNIRPLFARINIYCLKIAIVVETCETLGTQISEETMKKAIQYTNWLMESTLKICNEEIFFSEKERSEKLFMAHLREEKKIRRSDAMNRFNIDSWNMGNLTKTLVEKNLVEVIWEKNGKSKKPSQFLKLVEESKNGE